LPIPALDTVIVRFGGEIGIKALWTRKQYERRLTSNIKAVHKHYRIPASAFIRKAGRLYIKTDHADESAQRLSRVFGVSSVSPAVETSSKINNILETSTQLAKSMLTHNSSFAARCHRVGKHPYTSQDICEKVGEHILKQLPNLKLHVNLTKPDHTLQVEVREEKAYIFTQIIKGPGGLPLGTQPKLVCLLKGDIQSTAACWMTMKRGCPPVLIHYSDTSLAETKVQARKLMEWNIGFPRKLHVMKLNRSLSNEKNSLIKKRLMLLVAQRIAEMKKAEGIVAGDTLDNDVGKILHAFKLEDEAVKGFPVYRPLIGLDAPEINDIATRIGFTKPQTKQMKIKTEAKAASKRHEPPRHRADTVNLEKAVDETLKSLRILEI
jgi:thiamine biosynthesis protein ThiI